MQTLQYTQKKLKAICAGALSCDTARTRVHNSSGFDAALEIAKELLPSLHQ
jgi:hypothetical protein